MRIARVTHIFKLVVAVWIGCSTMAASANEQRDNNEAYLALLIQELAALNELIALAQDAQQVPGVQFRYDVLTRDIEVVRDGIVEHIERVDTTPRPIVPIRGWYE